MSIFVIILLLFLGVLLCLLEVLVIPGVTIAGIGGILLMGIGVYYSYVEFGTMGGHIVLFTMVVINAIIIVYSLKSKTWDKLMLKTNLKGAVDTDIPNIKVGDTAICLTRLAPMGKIRVGDYEVEASSISGLINEKTEVEVVKVDKHKIIVKLK